MNNEKLPIKFFAPREIDELKTEGGGNNELPKWVLDEESLKKRVGFLISSLSKVTKIISEKIDNKSPIPPIFVAKMSEDSTAKSKRRNVTSLFQTSNNNCVIGLTGIDKIMIKVESKQHLEEIKNRILDINNNRMAISCLENITNFKPHIENMNSNTSYKLKLIDYQDFEINQALQKKLENILKSKKIIFKKTNYTETLQIYKLESITSATLDDFINNELVSEMLFSLEPMPKYSVSLDSLNDDKNIPFMKPDENYDYKTLGILDNGISDIPYLKPWMLDKRWTVYPDNTIAADHGSFVAGIALYGDRLENRNWVGHKGIKIFDATVFPDTSKENIDEDELIHNIQEAIKSNYKRIKIWNLSLSIPREISNNKFSDFAIALDNIQDTYNVLVCKSAGNCNNFINNLPKGRIHEGADSIRSLVVGSLAHEKNNYDYADIDNPSPFSRIGPGPEFIIKPEVVHYGGNSGLDNNGNIKLTGVSSFSKDGKIVKNCGTSFSTPRIAALATGLYQEIAEEFDPLLLKALIIHSANYPKNLKIPNNERTKNLGFGIPKSISEIIYNKPSEVTLILRDNLPKGEYIDIMDFPMPKSLIKKGFYTGQIIATLVYNPILESSQGLEYCQSNIDIKFGSFDEKTERDTYKKNILNPVGKEGSQNLFLDSLFSKRLMNESDTLFALKERLLIQYGDKYYPVKKYAIDLEELTESNKIKYLSENKHWFLQLKGLFRDFSEQKAIREAKTLSQEFCLIFTIRDPYGLASVYDEVTQGLDFYNFWHSNIKLHSDIKITTNSNI